MVLLAFCVQPLGFLKILSESNGNIWQQVLLIHAVFIYLPVFLILSLFMYFGIVKKQPICSCKDILEAHQKILDRLPNKGKGNEITSCNDPFAKSSWFVRNSIILFCGYCVIGFLASVALFFFPAHFLHGQLPFQLSDQLVNPDLVRPFSFNASVLQPNSLLSSKLPLGIECA